MTKTYAGKVAIITGAAKGIGQALAVKFAERGAAVVLLDLEDCAETMQRVGDAGGEALHHRLDVASEAEWIAAAAAVKRRFGRSDILVNNAGIYPFQLFDQLDYALWSKVMRINLDGPFLGAKAFAPAMIEQGWGRIVNIASASVSLERVGLMHYNASKMGVIGLTRGLANELGQHGITANAVSPSITNTPGTSMSPDEQKKKTWSRQPIARFAEPGDIIGAVLFLTSDEASFITGQNIVVDGGLTKN